MDLEQQLAAWAARHRMWAPGDRIGVAVSGGSDSVALLLLLHALAAKRGWQLEVAHFDHGWRPESGADAGFVAELAAKLELPFHLGRAAGRPAADPEQAARRERYGFFQALMAAGGAASGAAHGLSAIATAHTLDDQAETVLLRLLRGTGPGGLAGVLPVRHLHPDGGSGPPGRVVRPLLWARHAQLQAWLRARAQPWREDASNRDLTRRRNWLRGEVLPLLSQANPAVVPRLGALADVARAEEEFWSAYLAPLSQRLWTRDAQGGLRAPRAAFAALPLAVQRRLLRDGIRQLQGHLRRLDFRALEAVIAALAAPVPRARHFPCGQLTCRLDHRQLELRPSASTPPAA